MILMTSKHVFTSQFSMVALQFFRALLIYFVYLLLIFFAIAFKTLSSALRLLTKFLYADAQRFRSALDSYQLQSNSFFEQYAIYQYRQVCWASLVIRASSYFDFALSSIIQNGEILFIFHYHSSYYNQPFLFIKYASIIFIKPCLLMIQYTPFDIHQVQSYMDLALNQAKQASKQDEVPVGCVFVDKQGKVVAQSHNLTNKYKNASRHCQINCIQKLTEMKMNIKNLILFVTVQPCIMCTYALNLMGISKVYFGQYNQRFGGCGSVIKANNFQAIGGIKQKESLAILKTFYEKGNQRIPEQMRNKSRKRVKHQ